MKRKQSSLKFIRGGGPRWLIFASLDLMRPTLLIHIASAVVSCDLPPPPVVTYYDRNGDGIVDFELHHHLRSDDTDYALCDTQFRGRYDLKINYNPFNPREETDRPVPTGVKVTPGQPPNPP
jgi:hypothetical protein